MSRQPKRWWVAIFVVAAATAGAAREQAPAQPPAARSPRPQPQVDPERARQLYVSKDPKDHGLGTDFQSQIQAKAETDRRYAEVAKGVVDRSEEHTSELQSQSNLVCRLLLEKKKKKKKTK